MDHSIQDRNRIVSRCTPNQRDRAAFRRGRKDLEREKKAEAILFWWVVIGQTRIQYPRKPVIKAALCSGKSFFCLPLFFPLFPRFPHFPAFFFPPRIFVRMSEEVKTETETPSLLRQASIGTVSTRVHESAVVDRPLNVVWERVRSLNFSWQSNVSSTELADGAAVDCVGSEHTITFSDGTIWRVKLVELSDIHTTLTYEVIMSEPPLPVMSMLNTIQLRRVSENNTTFVEWVTDFSNDADTAVVEDCRYKRLEALRDLRDSFN